MHAYALLRITGAGSQCRAMVFRGWGTPPCRIGVPPARCDHTYWRAQIIQL